MPKILFGISSSYCAHFMKGQVAYLASKGFDVVVISGGGEEIRHLCKEEGAVLYEVDFTRSITPLHDLSLLFKLVSILKKERPDVVNAGNPKPGLLLTLACWLTGLKARVFTLHGLVSDSMEGWKRTLMQYMEKLTCRLARKVLVVSPSLAEHAIAEGILPRSKSVVILHGSYNGIDEQRFSRTARVMAEAEGLRQDIGLDADAPVIGFIGRLTRDKGIALLVQAFDMIKAQVPNARLLLAGPPDEDDPVPEMQRIRHDSSIIYLGNVADIVPVYTLMDVLVLSSYREGFGNVLIEAAAMEVPVIAPAIHGCSDAVADGFNGRFFPRGDAVALANAILSYIRDPGTRILHGRNGRQFISRFNRYDIWEAQRQLYLSVMDK